MTPKNYLRAWISDFFGLDRESQDALLALNKIWRDRAAARALLKVMGLNMYSVECFRDGTREAVLSVDGLVFKSRNDLAQATARFEAAQAFVRENSK